MKTIMMLCLPLSLVAGEVNENEFHYLIDREIKDINIALEILNDPSDIYTRYWLQGMKEGLLNAKYIFNDCCCPHSGCE